MAALRLLENTRHLRRRRALPSNANPASSLLNLSDLNTRQFRLQLGHSFRKKSPRISSMQDTPSKPPFLVLTALLDSGARPAAVTRSHGDAMERAYTAATGKKTAGLDLIELPISKAAFDALRRTWHVPTETVGVYEMFPLASHLDSQLRNIAGQFLAAEKVWELEEKGLLGGIPINLKLKLPKSWSSDPKDVHKKLVEAGALDLDNGAIDTFNSVKSAWDASA